MTAFITESKSLSVDGSVNITSHRIGLLHGGGSVHRDYGDGNQKGDPKQKQEGMSKEHQHLLNYFQNSRKYLQKFF